MFCANFQTEFRKAKRLLEDKLIRFAAEAVTRIGGRLLVIIESDGMGKFTDLTAFEDDEKLMQSLAVAIRNAIKASAFMKDCNALDDDDNRLQCYVQALKELNKEQWRDEVGLFAARTLREYISIARGAKEKIGVIKIIIEGILLSRKK